MQQYIYMQYNDTHHVTNCNDKGLSIQIFPAPSAKRSRKIGRPRRIACVLRGRVSTLGRFLGV